MQKKKQQKELLLLLEEVWKKEPDFRFNQLLYDLYFNFSEKNNGYGEVKEISSDGFTKLGFDFFNLEDEKFIEYLEDILKNKL